MIFSPEIKLAINHCLAASIPFVAYRAPGEDVVFFADAGKGSEIKDRRFIINKWVGHKDENVVIADRVGAAEVLKVHSKASAEARALPEATDRAEYLSKVGQLVAKLQQRGGKTVISRTITGSADAPDWAERAELLFESYPAAFCHIYYMPQVGAWLGATPEILLKSSDSHQYSTMSLAGTHPVGQEWDEKNIIEQQIVTDFIADTLSPISKEIRVGKLGNLQYGAIEHLCTPINGVLNDGVTMLDVLSRLSPTPAVAGFPRDVALSEIAQIEGHDRDCYCGYIAVAEGKKLSAYVNLRCAQFTADGKYCIYAGGGITAASKPESEWAETSAKAASLLSILSNPHNG